MAKGKGEEEGGGAKEMAKGRRQEEEEIKNVKGKNSLGERTVRRNEKRGYGGALRREAEERKKWQKARGRRN